MAVVGSEKLDSHNLRDFLRIKDDDRHSNLNQSTSSSGGGGGSGRHNPPGLTLNAILSEKRSPAQTPAPIDDEPPLQRIQSNRTLLDIIREEQSPGLGGGGGRSSWRQLREKIRLGSRVGSGGGSSVWSSAVPVPASDVPINNHHHNYNNRTVMMMTRRPSTRFDPTIDSAESTQLDPGANGRLENNNLSRRRSIGGEDNRLLHDEERGGAAVGEEQPVRMSLMALLAENDRQMGLDGSAYLMDDDGDQGEGESVSGASAAYGGGAYNNCCVCMVRHKGAAFIPCGHTFCRLCCRELWVQRGNCPLCNNYILEILDIF